MRPTIYTQALARAAEMQCSTQALAGLLRVPENTLRRWMSGRAQMPLQAFIRLIDLIVEQEREAACNSAQSTSAGLVFDLGGCSGCCPRCHGERFHGAAPQAALRMQSSIVCSFCKASFVHGELLKAFATAAMKQSRRLHALKRLPPQPNAASLYSKTT